MQITLQGGHFAEDEKSPGLLLLYAHAKLKDLLAHVDTFRNLYSNFWYMLGDNKKLWEVGGREWDEREEGMLGDSKGMWEVGGRE